MTDWQTQIVLASILGGASLIKPPKGRNYYLSMRDKNQNWLKYKMAELRPYFGENCLKQYNVTFRCDSCCSEDFTKVYQLIYYENKRKVSMDILDRFQDVGLAVWFLDGGGKTGRNRKNAYLNCTKLGEEGTEIVLQYFNEIGMSCALNRNKDRLRLLFTISGTEKLFKVIAHRFPNFMYFRLANDESPDQQEPTALE